jgi:hypothetical protein
MWKNHSGNVSNRNVGVDNLVFSSGIWSKTNNNLFHEATVNPTSVGIGTKESFSRLSFGNGFDKEKLNLNAIAFHEKKDGKQGTGISFYKSVNKETDVVVSYGLKFIISDENDDMTTDAGAKLYLTNDSKMFLNKKPNTESKLLLNIGGNMGCDGYLKIGTSETGEEGAIRFKDKKLEIFLDDAWKEIAIKLI